MNRTHKCKICGEPSGIFELCSECYKNKLEKIKQEEDSEIEEFGNLSDNVRPRYSCKIVTSERKNNGTEENILYLTNKEHKLNIFDEIAFATMSTLTKNYHYQINIDDFITYVSRLSNKLVRMHYEILRDIRNK